MVSTSMLPGIGMMELSARPSSSRLGPPRWRSQVHSLEATIKPSGIIGHSPGRHFSERSASSTTALKGPGFSRAVQVEKEWRLQPLGLTRPPPMSALRNQVRLLMVSPEARLGGREFCSLHELESRSGRQGTTLGGVTIEQLQPSHASGIKLVVNVLSEIRTNFTLGKADSRRPTARNLRDIFGLHTVVAGGLEYRCQIGRSILQRRTPDRPEGEHERLSGEANQFFREIEGKALEPVDLERGVANDEPCIVTAQHLVKSGSHGREGAPTTHPALKQDFGKRHRR